MIPNNIQRRESSSKTIEERRWELLKGVRKSLEDLNQKELENQSLTRFKLNQKNYSLIEAADQFKNFKEKISKQQENLKLRLLIASRERNVYLEKLRKVEEYGEDKNWNDENNLLKKIYEILYNDAN